MRRWQWMSAPPGNAFPFSATHTAFAGSARSMPNRYTNSGNSRQGAEAGVFAVFCPAARRGSSVPVPWAALTRVERDSLVARNTTFGGRDL